MLKLVQTFERHEGRAWHASWSPDGTKIASCGEDKIIRIWGCRSRSWDLNQMVCLATLEEGQSRTIRCVEWSPGDGNMIASASFDGSVVVWQAQDQSFTLWEKAAALEGHDSEVKSVAWSYDGTFLASCGRDKKVWVWERLQGGEFECVAMLEGHTQDVKFVRWHPSVNALFSCGYDDVVKVWMDDGDDDWFCVSTMTAHSSTVWGCTFSGDTGRSCVSVSDDRSLLLWENDSPYDPRSEWMQTASVKEVSPDPIYSCDWSHAHNSIAVGCGDNSIRIYTHSRADDGRGALSLEFTSHDSHEGDVNCVRWNPHSSTEPTAEGNDKSSLLVSAGDDGVIKVWALSS